MQVPACLIQCALIKVNEIKISGGPLMHIRRIERGSYYELIGVVSFGWSYCELSDDPGVYGRVTSVLSWIEGKIQGDGSINCPINY